MTTIAYANGVLASDSQVTCNDVRDGYAKKVWKEHGMLLAASGSRATALKFQAWVRTGCMGGSPFDDKETGNGLLITPDRKIIMFACDGPTLISTPYYTLGSGAKLALGAILAGADAIGAVQAAIEADVYSGGPIQVISFYQAHGLPST